MLPAEKEYLMTQKLSVLTGLLAVSLLCGCGEERREYDKKNEYTDSQVSSGPLTLIGKEVRSSMGTSNAYLYFAVEGETNKVSFVAIKRLPCEKASAKVFEARIGDKKLPTEWRKSLTHRGEDACPFEWAAEDRLRHEMIWSYVRED